MQGLSQLYYLHGIGYDFIKYTGEHVVFDEQTRSQALRCCGIDTANQKQINKLNFELDIAPWLVAVGDVSIVEQKDTLFKVRMPDYQCHGIASIHIKNLNYEYQFDLSKGMIVGEFIHEDTRYVEVAYQIMGMPAGYFDAKINLPEGQYNTQIWSVPNECYKQTTHPTTGISVQLYTLYSDRNLGIGDFADLDELIIHSAQSDCDYILLNPLHLLFTNQQHRVSPYSPNHRCLLNPLYIAIDRTQEYAMSEQLQNDYQQCLVSLQAQKQQPFIDYKLISEYKYDLLTAVYTHFKHNKTQQHHDKFIAFTQQFAAQLKVFNNDECAIYWQYLAHQQLNDCQQLCIKKGMAIGLINDLAVGCSQDSLEYKINQDLYAADAHIGAPPDPWAESGQDWGLPALNPMQLSKNKYAFFKQLLRSNMASVGGLRIDHVMAIRRLWWCFNINNKAQGCYVYYPFEHLIALLKIESQLQKNMIIGEDLGVVPPEIKTAMQDANMLGNILFYFEKDQHGEFIPPTQLRHQALLMVANHDVPPFAAWWQAQDLSIKVQYKLLADNALASERAKRTAEKVKLLHWFTNAGVTHLHAQSEAREVYENLLYVLAKSTVSMLCLQLDDLDEQALPVNIPGTYLEYPNWRRRLSQSVSDIFINRSDFIKTLTQSRKGL
ncbi:hypothetical protein PSECIP111951_03675 [Pseudoalteromonas holothuriae]|uniref:4-alpha-glucanotransferase n=1 Tax=Pseudoalteromonas holothuriae TaxID=2963714 RepID=A0A9W4R1D6_9GAMM|nr:MULTISPECIES: 4-alpha-glucanotransferase [unclassified Pseudoalteromonas]CAH9062358.1 hypothetical protein PSECIP111854_02996 [Pseudoalteromonas sp. CIP111854]CAH9066938.1 hypothetical protein PSECIP111951_03675 [Pseudoalteromonas sp. CIP111951]